MIMKKKIIIAAGILVVIAVGAGVYLNHPSGGGVDQEILARLAGQYGIPYDDDMDDDRSEERRVGKECRSRWSPYH